MSIEYTCGERRVSIGDNVALKFVSKSEEYYAWNEVFIETENETKKIGSYFTDPGSHEHMVYNSNFVVFLRYDPYIPSMFVTSIFDVQSNQMVEGTTEELLEIYNREFNNQEEKPLTMSKVNNS